jgi:hypothetical protein
VRRALSFGWTSLARIAAPSCASCGFGGGAGRLILLKIHSFIVARRRAATALVRSLRYENRQRRSVIKSIQNEDIIDYLDC